MKKWFLSVLAVVMTVFICSAAEIDGKWKAKMEGPDGGMELVFKFKAEGQKLTGAIESPMGEMPISNGKIEGNNFSFDIDFNGNAMPHTGKIEGGQIKLKMGNGDGPMGGEMTLTKVTE